MSSVFDKIAAIAFLLVQSLGDSTISQITSGGNRFTARRRRCRLRRFGSYAIYSVVRITFTCIIITCTRNEATLNVRSSAWTTRNTT